MNKLFLIAGHSGSGKTSVMREVMSNELVSFTTRPMRQGEIDGKTYHYITLDEFYDLKNSGELVEEVEYDGNFYGISKGEFENKLKKDNAFCIVDIYGVEQFKKIYDNCVTIFIYTTYENTRERLVDRGDSDQDIDSRLLTYDEEMSNKGLFDYVVKNNDGQFNKTVEIFKKIIESEVGK